MYVADTWNHRIQVFDTAGGYAFSWGRFGDTQGEAEGGAGVFWGPRDVATDAEKDAVINRVHGKDRGWMLGDIIHSEPAVVHYWTVDTHDKPPNGNNDNIPQDEEMESYVLVGANDGMLHMFRDSDGFEMWGFIPPDLLPTLKGLLDSDPNHDYYVDGPPVIYERWDDDGDGYIEDNEVFNLVFFGERRGGYYYYALDISDPDEPEYIYIITPYHLRAAADKDGVDDPLHTDADLGQSWVKPEKRTLFVDSDADGIPDSGETVDVLLLAGGYDENQDLETPQATDNVGRSVFAIQVDDTDGNGEADVKYLNFNGSNYFDMTHCIIDISGVDTDANGFMDAVYAGDFRALGQAMIANNEAQRRLHADLISSDAQRVVDIAREHGALGWKVNGAGGEGGSLTVLTGPSMSAKRSMMKEIREDNPLCQGIPINLSRYGLRVWTLPLEEDGIGELN